MLLSMVLLVCDVNVSDNSVFRVEVVNSQRCRIIIITAEKEDGNKHTLMEYSRYGNTVYIMTHVSSRGSDC
jgi:hypothetical protein